MRITQKHQSTQKLCKSHLEGFLNKDEIILILELILGCDVNWLPRRLGAGASVSDCSSDSVVSANQSLVKGDVLTYQQIL